MCGVFGTTRPDIWPNLDAVVAQLRHRGPDGAGCWTASGGGAALAHTRLAIIGLGDEGAQPATSRDGGLTVSYNGEIYNFRDVGPEVGLQEAGSDTQVLCEALRHRGVAGLGMLRGMYAFAAWDSRSERLIAGRDPWGIKPLYVLRHAQGGVTLSSEIGPLLGCADGREIDPLGLAHLILNGHSASNLTIYRNITKVPPGVVIEWTRTDDRWQERFYSVPEYRTEERRDFGAALDDSVRAHLVSDVEVGLFLSGGTDSTLLAAIASQYAPEIRTYTISFPEHPDLDESRLAEANARSLGLRSTTLPVSTGSMVSASTSLMKIHGEPFMDAAALPLVCLSEVAAADVKVVLTGEGADELMAGYGRYRVSRLLDRAWLSVLSRPFRPLAPWWSWRRGDQRYERAVETLLWGKGWRGHVALLGSELGWASNRDMPAADDAGRLTGSEWQALQAGTTQFEMARAYDAHRWLPNVYLEKADRASMLASLEARVPYLDPVVASSCRTLGVTDKSCAERELGKLLPNLQKPARKKGLAVPLVGLLGEGLGSDARYELESEESVLRRVLGERWQSDLRQRAERSSLVRFRMAMLGVWEQTVGQSLE